MRKLIKADYLKSTGIMLLLMLMVFFITQDGVQASGKGLFVRKAVVCSLSLYICQVASGTGYFSRRWLSSHLMVILWLLYIVFKKTCFHGNIYEDEIFIAVYSSIGIILLERLRVLLFPQNSIIAVLFDLPKLVLTWMPLVQIVHWCIYGSEIILEEMMAVNGTSLREGTEWNEVYVGLTPVAAILAIVIFELWLFGFIRKRFSEDNIVNANTKGKVAIILILAIGVFVYPVQTIVKSDWTGHYVEAVRYTHELQEYNHNVDAQIQGVNFVSKEMICSKPHTVVVVIGESSCRDKMKAFNDDYEYENTPWASAHKNDNEFTFFSHGYSTQSMTQQVLELALSEKSAYNDVELLQAMNIVDIARAKGYKVYWITNLSGDARTAFYGLTASRADKVIRLNVPYDNSLVASLAEVNPEENNLVIFHGNGSHAAYADRYPADKARFAADTVEGEYANAIYFVDKMLGDIFDYCRKNLNLQAMIYFSDHGEDLLTGHGPSDKNFAKVRIPVMIYTSPEYMQLNSDKIKALKAHRDTFFTNDMMYNTMCSLIKAESNYYNSHEDLASDNYSYQLDDLLTFGGKAKVNEDHVLTK